MDRVDYKDTLGYALQAGFDYGITEHWSLNMEVKKMFIDTKVSIDRGALRNDADVDIDPWVFGIGVAYRF
ncbi:MAG: outer membrane beta-barrel protein [Gammaproteobacteria bacterium]|nr:outer membrane beta-barrel protein [Gammaproteobacteria bacterium]